MSRYTRCKVDLVLSDEGSVRGTILAPMLPDDPERRQAVVKLDGDHWIYAYTPEALEDLAEHLNLLAGEMRTDRTLARAKQERATSVADADVEAGAA